MTLSTRVRSCSQSCGLLYVMTTKGTSIVRRNGSGVVNNF